MKFRIKKEEFLDGLQQVQHVVSSRTTLPILSNVLLEVEDGELKLTTTDLDVGVSCSVNAEVEKSGATTLPARRLASIIRELPSNDIAVEVDNKNVATIRSGPSFFRIIGLGGDEFPPLPDFQESREFKIPQRVLREGLKKTAYAISSDETRYVLNGIFASFKDGKLTLVATDGRRLAMVENEVEFPQSQEIDLIIPTKAVHELQRLLTDSDSVVKIYASESQVAFEFESAILVSKLIEGNYPNYRQVIPAETKERIVIDREMLLTIVSRVSLLAAEKTSSVKMQFTADSIDVVSSAQDIGDAREGLPVTYGGAEFAIAFNPEFLMAPLRALTEDQIYLDLSDEMSPGVIRTEGSFLYVLMPMRINN